MQSNRVTRVQRKQKEKERSTKIGENVQITEEFLPLLFHFSKLQKLKIGAVGYNFQNGTDLFYFFTPQRSNLVNAVAGEDNSPVVDIF